MQEINLTQGQRALVDDVDFESLSRYKWCAIWQSSIGGYYAATQQPWPDGPRRQKMILMHRLILLAVKDQQVDHRDHNGLNNQKQNLRLCSSSQNQMNRKKKPISSSKFKGVTWHKRDQKWQASIKINNKSKHLGYFNSEIEAARAYEIAADDLFGDFSCIEGRI